MDWNQNYIEKHTKLQGWSFRYVVNSRILRFKSNPPLKHDHFSELEYLILNHDYSKSLLKKYENILSEKFKTEWLEKKLQHDPKFSNKNYHIFDILLPFYLINPETKNKVIDKHFLNDQLLIILGCLDHKFRKYRWRANYLFEFLIPSFSKLRPSFRIRLIELLTLKSTKESIRNINQLIFRNSEIINKRLIDDFVRVQLSKGLVSPKMAIGYLRRFRKLDNSNFEELKNLVSRIDNGEKILIKINLVPNKT
ncbi:hypothetical protein [Tenacibaculum sp. M341]|uniref:hypothetical protein n=1 Tax=Tenacibaculum sp. M341 TaxID=2530339 RepID=UPI001052A5E4|nr:hypothetical protein [Tenacibaculum sp. M341]TCI84375.1 hypothetical protein EYW44_21725 [Tenacibaculum sp. M341]